MQAAMKLDLDESSVKTFKSVVSAIEATSVDWFILENVDSILVLLEVSCY